jgi:hypothetical protein
VTSQTAAQQAERIGDRHACLLYRDEQAQLRATAQFLATGLAMGYRGICLLDGRTTAEIADALADVGVDASRKVAHGALRIAPARGSYVPGETFDGAAMIALVQRWEAEARADGYAGLAATADMSWALGGDLDALLAYEERLNRTAFCSDRLAGLCQYDERRFAGPHLAPIIDAHRVEREGSAAAE